MATALQVEFLLAGLIDNAGEPLQSGTVGFFETDGVTPKTIWEDADKLSISANPVTLGVRGQADIFADGLYSVVIKDSSGSTLSTPQSLSYDTELGADIFGIDASLFGSGDDSDAIAQAIASASGADTNIILRNKEWDIDVDLTVPTNINLLFIYGAYHTLQAGITETINGTITADLYNIFRGAGTVVIADRNNDIPSIWLIGGTHGDRTLDGVVTFPDEILVNEVGSSATNITVKAPLVGDPSPVEVEDDFEVDGRGSATDTETGNIDVKGAQSTNASPYALLGLYNFDTTGTSADVLMASISAFKVGVDSSSLVLSTKPVGGGILGRIYILDDGKVGVGVDVPNYELDLLGDMRIRSAGLLRFGGTGLGDDDISISRIGVTTFGIVGDMDFQTNDILNVTNLAGTLSDPAQPNVTSLGTLTSLTLSGDITGGANLQINGWELGTASFNFAAGLFMQTSTVAADRFFWDNDNFQAISTADGTSIDIDRVLGKISAKRSLIVRDTVRITSTLLAGTAINAAITAFGSNGGIIYIPAGDYEIDVQINLDDNVEIIGDGKDDTKLEPSLGLTTIIGTSSKTNIKIRDLTLDGTGLNTANYCLQSAGTDSNVLLKNVKFEGPNIDLVDCHVLSTNWKIIDCEFVIPATRTGITAPNKAIIRNCEFSGTLATSEGITVDSVDDVTIEDCRFTAINVGIINNSGSPERLTVSDCFIDNCNTGIKYDSDSDTVKIINNTFNSCNTMDINFTDDAIDVIIKGNSFINGVASILATRCESMIIDNNIFQNSVAAKCIQAPTAQLPTNTGSIHITNNIFKDISGNTSVIDVIAPSATIEKSTCIITNNSILNISGSASSNKVIDCSADNAIIKGNIINEVSNSLVGVPNVDGIFISGENVICQGNVIRNFDISAGPGTIDLIEINSSNNIISDNHLLTTQNNASPLVGIEFSGAATDVLNIQGNMILVSNAGAGAATAFNVTAQDGVASGNTYAGSDGLGTLAITAGIVANNDG